MVGLSECLIQVYGCPSNCRLCYNAQLCIECYPTHFNTPDYLCVKDCTGYLQLYLPYGDSRNFTSKLCVPACPPKYYATTTSSLYICSVCLEPCLTCLSPTQCLTCITPYYYYEIGLACLTVCPNTHYPVDSSCSPCSAPCSTCLNQTTCLTCSIGYYHLGHCSANCPTGTFRNSSGNICSPCDSACMTCEGTSSFCLSCNSAYLLLGSSCQ